MPRRRRQKVRPQLADQHHRHHVHGRGQEPRDNASDEQLADVLLGDDAVDGKHGRRRQHGAERAAGGNHAGGEALRIIVTPHFRVGDGGKGRRGGDRGARDRGKPGASGDGGDAEPALKVADEGIGGTKQFAAHARIGHEGAHQQEHRDDAEGIIGHRAHRGQPDAFQRRRAADQISEAGDADQAHRHADRHAQQHQREQADEAEDRDGVGTHGSPHAMMPHSTGLYWYLPPSNSGWKISR